MKLAEKAIWLLGFIGSMNIILAYIVMPLIVLLWIIFFDRDDNPPMFP